MQNNIKQRLNALEERAMPKEGVKLLFTEALPEEDKDYKESSGYIIDKCEAACDRETYEKALGDALLSLTGDNPLLANAIRFIDITTEIAVQVVNILKEEGIEVML